MDSGWHGSPSYISHHLPKCVPRRFWVDLSGFRTRRSMCSSESMKWNEWRKTVHRLAAPTEDASCNAMSCVDLGAQGHDAKPSLDNRVEEYCRLVVCIQSSIKTSSSVFLLSKKMFGTSCNCLYKNVLRKVHWSFAKVRSCMAPE